MKKNRAILQDSKSSLSSQFSSQPKLPKQQIQQNVKRNSVSAVKIEEAASNSSKVEMRQS